MLVVVVVGVVGGGARKKNIEQHVIGLDSRVFACLIFKFMHEPKKYT